MILPKSYLFASLVASVATAQQWGNFSGEVESVKFVSENLYALTSDITISLAEGWSFVDLIGRTEGQISNKTIVFNSADSKYYGKLALTNTATSDTQDEVCFPSVPIRISLNQQTDGSTSGRLINGNIFIGCVDKSRIGNYPTASASSTTHASSKDLSATTTVATSDVKTTDSASPSASVSGESTTLFGSSANTTSEAPSALTTAAISDVVTEASASGSALVSNGSATLSNTAFSSISVHYSTVVKTTASVHLPIITGVHGNNTLITSYTPTGTSFKNVTATGVRNVTGTGNVTGSGIIINQNSGAANSISFVLSLSAIVMGFALFV